MYECRRRAVIRARRNHILIMSAIGCGLDTNYQIAIFGESGAIYGQTYFPQADEVGNFTQSISGLLPGDYDLRLSIAGESSKIYHAYVAVTESTEPVIYECGSPVSTDTSICSSGTNSNCCPVNCPPDYKDLPGNSTFNTQRVCMCGKAGLPECPPGNDLHFPACDAPLTPNADGVCTYNPGGNSYFCGERIDDADVQSGNFICQGNGCPATALDGGGLWCACGGPEQSCCPASGDTENFIATYICQPGLECNGQTSSAAGTCAYKLEAEGTASQVGRGCSSVGYVNTAIGCIPFTIISQTAKFFLQWSISIGGGIALFLIGLSAIMFATSSGNPQKVQSAKSLFMAAVGGLLFILLSVFLLRVIGVNVLGLFS